MEAFTALFYQIDQTQSTNEKVEYLQTYFEAAQPEDAAWALFFLSGRKLKRLLSSKVLFELCHEVTHLPAWLIEESYEVAGDTAETIALLLRNTSDTKDREKLSLAGWVEK